MDSEKPADVSPLPPAAPPTIGPVLLDSENPQKWPQTRKWIYTVVVVMMTGLIAFCSSLYTAAIPAIATQFNVSKVIATLGVTTFLLGFASGPLLFAPLSEVFGRKIIYRVTLCLFTLMQLACALVPNIAGLLILRFLSGFFGSPTVTISGGSLTDLWIPAERSVPLALFTAASFLGPVMAPVAGGFLTEGAGWRWNFWLLLIMSGVVYALMFFLLPETYAPKLLEWKSQQYDKDNTASKSKAGESFRNSVKSNLASTATVRTKATPRISFTEKYVVSLTRPWIMLFTEPILLSLSLYMAFVYGILYLNFIAYPLIFTSTRHWSTGVSGLSFLGIGAGMALATVLSPFLTRLHAHYTRKIGPVPETRLPHLILLAWLIPLGLFWFGWTAEPPRPWPASVIAGVPFGFGLVTLFLGITAYLTDCYGRFAASALAANAVLRSLSGAVFPLFGESMYDRLGTPWATSLLGFVAVGMAPLPWVFYSFGPRLRAASKFHMKEIE